MSPEGDRLPSEPRGRVGYQRILDRHPEMRDNIRKFEEWLQGVEQWLNWIDKNVPGDLRASRREVLEDFHFTSQGLELLERLDLDIYAEHDGARAMYDVKKLLRAVVALPTIARLKGKKLSRKKRNITTVFKEVIDDTLTGKLDIASISQWPGPEEDTEESGEGHSPA